MSEVELPIVFKTLLFRIHTITGWKIPDDDLFLKILIDEFSKFMVEQYNNLNADEISFAFRNYGTTVKDWGKSMSLSLISEPISKYVEVRKCLSEMEDRKTSVQPTPVMIAPILDENELLETVKHVYQKTKKVGLIPVKVYEILHSRNEIKLSSDQKVSIRTRVITKINTEALEDGEIAVAKLKALSASDWENKVRNECKKQAVANYFEHAE